MDKNDRFLNKVHASGQMGWGKRPLQQRLDEKAGPAEEARMNVPKEEVKSVPRMDATLEREIGENREASLPKDKNPIPTGDVAFDAGKIVTGQSLGLRLEDLKLHEWVNGTGEPVDPERKRMAGLKLNEKDMR